MTTKPLLRSWAYVVIGAIVMLALDYVVRAQWTAYYSHFPFEGYSHAMAEGLIRPSVFSSARSSLHMLIVLASLPMLTLWFSAVRVRDAAIALWVGVMLVVFTMMRVAMAGGEDMPMWPIDLVMVGCETGLPILIGATVFRSIRAKMAWT